jgi:hypothetical protein
MSSQYFTTPGTYTWTCPAGVTSVAYYLTGGGGGGDSGCGGGGGGFTKGTTSVIPGNNYTVVVGAGGAGVWAPVGEATGGGTSYFISFSDGFYAGGGGGGYEADPVNGGFGFTFNGGTGSCNTGSWCAGGGGGAGGDTGDGNVGSTDSDGIGGAGGSGGSGTWAPGGAGGKGADYDVANAANGDAPGGGGGGNSWLNESIGNGADGQAVLVWEGGVGGSCLGADGGILLTFSVGPSYISHVGLLSSISVTMPFEWNILSVISTSQVFTWEVGDGPLYWYVVESEPFSTCPTMSTTATEVWTVMATSVAHLCERLQDQNYNRTIKSIKQWTVPALQCDADKLGISCNDLISVDFCDCQCISFISPSSFSTCSLTCPPSVVSFINVCDPPPEMDMFSAPRMLQIVSEGSSARTIELLRPVAKPLTVIGYNRPVSAVLKLSHNLLEVPILQNLVDRGLCKVPEQVALHYNAVTESWQYSQHFLADKTHWSIMFTLANQGNTWILQSTIGRVVMGKNNLTKIRVGFQKLPINQFAIEAAYDFASKKITSNYTVHYKSISDGLNLLSDKGLLTLKVGEK